MRTLNEIPEEYYIPGTRLVEVGVTEELAEQGVKPVQSLVAFMATKEETDPDFDPDQHLIPNYFVLVEAEKGDIEKIRSAGHKFWLVFPGRVPVHAFGMIEPYENENGDAPGLKVVKEFDKDE